MAETVAQPGPSGSPQLTLPIGLQDEATLANFYPREALAGLLHALHDPRREHLNYLHGHHAVGKSHLLQALCHEVPRALYLPLASVSALPPAELLRDLESSALLAVDDLHCVAGRRDWEEALFHLCNRARQRSCALWFAATRPAPGLDLGLADLRSRLAGGVTWAMPESSDEEKMAILGFRARRRGLELPESVARYLCARGSRSLSDLLGSLDRLDAASLQLQRPLTVPLVKMVMGW